MRLSTQPQFRILIISLIFYASKALSASDSSALRGLLVFISCSGLKSYDESKPLLPEQVMQDIRSRISRVTSFTGNGRITIDTPEFAENANISVRILEPDSIMVEIRQSGFLYAKGLVTRNQFTFWNAWENWFVQDSTNAKTLQQIFRLRIDFQDLIEILSGAMDIRISPAEMLKGTRSNDSYSIMCTDDNGREEYFVDLSREIVTRRIKMDERGNILEEVTYKDLRKRAGMFLPGVITPSSRRNRDTEV
jgi:hypothetical protein